jgi:hypothetical protein
VKVAATPLSEQAVADAGRRRRMFFRIVVGLLLYVASYSILSFNGRYLMRPSGEVRYRSSGMAAFDLFLWHPTAVNWERRRSVSGEFIIDADLLGWLYFPLLAMDRRWVHPTVNIFDSAGKTR